MNGWLIADMETFGVIHGMEIDLGVCLMVVRIG